ncbi:hypothetical protein AB0L65_35985 [Nonomuraea sp. NPDC052116]|uniref:hypothetical protein n=1 Tax=Nonomuraea sp. NPDC052116 TaxID=3155665 RepID=UPI00343BA11B
MRPEPAATKAALWLKFIGVKEVHTLVVDGTTWGGNEKGEEKIALGQEEARKLAADF